MNNITSLKNVFCEGGIHVMEIKTGKISAGTASLTETTPKSVFHSVQTAQFVTPWGDVKDISDCSIEELKLTNKSEKGIELLLHSKWSD